MHFIHTMYFLSKICNTKRNNYNKNRSTGIFHILPQNYDFLTPSNSKEKSEISLTKIQCQSTWKLNEWRKEWLCLHLQKFRWACFVASLFSIFYRALWPPWEASRQEGLCQLLNDWKRGQGLLFILSKKREKRLKVDKDKRWYIFK